MQRPEIASNWEICWVRLRGAAVFRVCNPDEQTDWTRMYITSRAFIANKILRTLEVFKSAEIQVSMYGPRNY